MVSDIARVEKLVSSVLSTYVTGSVLPLELFLMSLLRKSVFEYLMKQPVFSARPSD